MDELKKSQIRRAFESGAYRLSNDGIEKFRKTTGCWTEMSYTRAHDGSKQYNLTYEPGKLVRAYYHQIRFLLTGKPVPISESIARKTIKRQRKIVSQATLNEIIKLRSESKSILEVSKTVGIPYSTTHYWCDKIEQK